MLRFREALVFAVLFTFLSPQARADGDGKILDKTKDEWLAILANDEKPRMRKAAVIALGIYGPGQRDVLPALNKALLGDKDDSVRVQIIQVMGSIDRKELRDALPTLSDALKDDKSSSVKAGAAGVMGKLGELAKPALNTLIICLKDPDVRVRAAAVDTIGKIGPDAAKPAMAEMLPLLKDTDSLVRYSTVSSYGRMGLDASFVVPDILQVLESDSAPDVRREAAHTLALIGSTTPKLVLPAAIKALQNDKSEEVRRQLAVALATMGDIRGAMTEILSILRSDKDPGVRVQLVRSISGALGSELKAYVKDLAEWLPKEPDSDARLAIIQELGALGPGASDGLEALKRCENDVVLQVRDAAKQAVRQVKGIAKK